MSEKAKAVLAGLCIRPNEEYSYSTCLRVAEAARKAALEEAAKVCDGMDELAVAADWDSSDGIACEVKRACVATLRALAQGGE